eukprot:2186830-Rhodomonas_salina.3
MNTQAHKRRQPHREDILWAFAGRVADAGEELQAHPVELRVDLRLHVPEEAQTDRRQPEMKNLSRRPRLLSAVCWLAVSLLSASLPACPSRSLERGDCTHSQPQRQTLLVTPSARPHLMRVHSTLEPAASPASSPSPSPSRRRRQHHHHRPRHCSAIAGDVGSSLMSWHTPHPL